MEGDEHNNNEHGVHECQEGCETCADWWGYDEHEEPIELNAYVSSGVWGYHEEWNVINSDTINLLRTGQGKGARKGGNKGKTSQFKACFNCGNEGHL